MNSERVQRYQQGITKPEDLIPAPLTGTRTINLSCSNIIPVDKQTFAKDNNMKYSGHFEEEDYSTFSGYRTGLSIDKSN